MNKENTKKFVVDPSDFTPNSSKSNINGSCRIVSFVTQKSTGQNCVLKTTNDSIKKSENLLYNEAEILSKCHHPTIVPFIGFFIEKGKLNIYLKEIEKGSLEENIKKNKGNNTDPLWNDTHKLIISYGIACALKYLHSLDIIHQNLKPTNILLNSELFPYVTDFETTNQLENISDELGTNIPAVSFMAPELFQEYMRYNQTKPIDVYSYSMVLYYLWSGQYPYPSDYNVTQIIQRTLENNRPTFPDNNNISDKLKELIKKCWSQNPKERPTFSEIVDQFESTDFITSTIDTNLFSTYKQSILTKTSSITNIDEFNLTEKRKYMALLKKSAESGNAEAQNSFALHLYNGYNISKDRNSAIRYFELSTENGNEEAKLWLSLILIREGREVEKAASYLSQVLSSPNSKVPEALSLYGQQLASQGNNQEAASILLSAIQLGSISAISSYANIMKCNSFYNVASNCCHCLDTVGFFFPVDHHVFRCDDCSAEVCEGCAKSCHKDHKVVEIGTKHAFVCGCGKCHFNGHCSVEFVGEMKFNGEPQIYQHFFWCADCCIDEKANKKFICRACAEKCHSGHRIVDCGIQKGVCCCGTNNLGGDCKCKILKFDDISSVDNCSAEISESPIMQRWFQCVSCGNCNSDDDGICMKCAEKCHAEHVVIDRGVKCAKCRCCNTNKCQFKK